MIGGRAFSEGSKYLLPLNSQTAQESRQSRRSERKAPPADASRALCATPQRAACVVARRGSNAVSRAFWDYIFGSGCVAEWSCAVVWLGRGRRRARGIPVPAARCVGPQRPRASQQAQVDVSGTGWHGSGDSCGRMGALVGKFLWLSTRAGARGGDGRRRHGDADHHRGVTPLLLASRTHQHDHAQSAKASMVHVRAISGLSTMRVAMCCILLVCTGAWADR